MYDSTFHKDWKPIQIHFIVHSRTLTEPREALDTRVSPMASTKQDNVPNSVWRKKDALPASSEQ